MNYNRGVKRACPPSSAAWQLLVRFLATQRAALPPVAAELELSPAQCHVLHLLEPDRPLPMGRLAKTLSCDASNVTGLVDRLESRGLVRRRPSPEDRRVKIGRASCRERGESGGGGVAKRRQEGRKERKRMGAERRRT